ncbi:MAG: threonylcarbamoyl-AMP synthase [Desulfobacterales bacterium]|nr:threonylcarbamoyl-AMP synthase [Desulfobacterales bacterium]
MGTPVTISENQITPAFLDATSRTLKEGGCIVIPTFCLYGMAANAMDEAAVRRIFDIKKRPLINPILLLIKDTEAVRPLVNEIPENAIKLMNAFWPGNLTIVFRASKNVPSVITAGTGKVGLRVPSHPITRAICQAVPFPLTGTSANIAGEPGVSTFSDLHPDILDQADLSINAGTLAGGNGSTVVDITTSPVTILREGTIPESKIHTILGYRRHFD